MLSSLCSALCSLFSALCSLVSAPCSLLPAACDGPSTEQRGARQPLTGLCTGRCLGFGTRDNGVSATLHTLYPASGSVFVFANDPSSHVMSVQGDQTHRKIGIPVGNHHSACSTAALAAGQLGAREAEGVPHKRKQRCRWIDVRHLNLTKYRGDGVCMSTCGQSDAIRTI